VVEPEVDGVVAGKVAVEGAGEVAGTAERAGAGDVESAAREGFTAIISAWAVRSLMMTARMRGLRRRATRSAGSAEHLAAHFEQLGHVVSGKADRLRASPVAALPHRRAGRRGPCTTAACRHVNQ